MTISTLTIIFAQAKKEPAGGGLASLLILILPMAALVYMMTVPQRKQRQKQADMLRAVEVGDEVVTTGGIVGVVTFVEDELFHVEVDDDVVIRVAKNAISKNLSTASQEPPAKARKGLLEGALGGGAKASKPGSEPDEAVSRTRGASAKDSAKRSTGARTAANGKGKNA